MEAKELRLGNYVYVEAFDSIATISALGKVPNLIENAYSNYIGFDIEGIGYGQNACNPIPITEEWLVKFGFEKVIIYSVVEQIHYQNSNCWIYLIQNGFEFELITKGGRFNLFKTYKYVHELQNLYFAITGEELIFKK